MFPGNERRFSERSSLRVLSQVRDIQPVDSMSVTFEYTPKNRNSPGYIFLLKNAVGEGAFNLTYAFQNGTGAISFAEDGKKSSPRPVFPLMKPPAACRCRLNYMSMVIVPLFQ